MELTLKRIKTTNIYTLSRLSETGIHGLIAIDIVEPPVAGLTMDTVKTFDPGIYKLFLKSDVKQCAIIPTFQCVAQRPRLSILPLLVESHFSAVKCVKREPFRAAMFAGRAQGENLVPDKEQYDRLMTRLFIAKQQKEIIFVKIK